MAAKKKRKKTAKKTKMKKTRSKNTRSKKSKTKKKKARSKKKASKKKASKKKAVKKTSKKKASKKRSLKTPRVSRYGAQTSSRINHSAKLKAGANSKIKIGQQAPHFTLLNQDGQMVSLEDFVGKNVVLYFYPRDMTPGCTQESCDFRDAKKQFTNLDTIILGVSFDDQNSHQRFIKKYKLNFQLLSDLNKDVAKAYGCYVKKNMYGNIKWGIQRSTFVIDMHGKVAAVFPKVKVDGHAKEVKAALSSINQLQVGS
jgi:peroxiredoxin Q/BCP